VATEITNLLKEMDDSAARADGEMYYQQNLQFHSTIISAANHTKTQQLYLALVKEMHIARKRTLASVESMKASNEEHHQLFFAIKAGDGVKARKLAEKHVESGNSRRLKMIRDGYFEGGDGGI
jgi:DNA-binding GntR family transcriptional regulator